MQSVQSLRGGLQPVQPLRGQDLQSLQSLCGGLQPVQSLRGGLQSVQSLRGQLVWLGLDVRRPESYGAPVTPPNPPG